MKRAPFVKKESGESFTKLVFPDYSIIKGTQEIVATSAVPKDKESSYLMVGFSSNLGELSNAELQKQLDALQVCQLESGSFKLCKAGEGQWQTVDIELWGKVAQSTFSFFLVFTSLLLSSLNNPTPHPETLFNLSILSNPHSDIVLTPYYIYKALVTTSPFLYFAE